MKRMDHKKKNIGKVVTGMLMGSVVGTVVGWLTAPVSGEELRRRITGDIEIGNGSRHSSRRSLQEKIKTSEGNVESRARELAAEVNENAGDIKKTVSRSRKITS